MEKTLHLHNRLADLGAVEAVLAELTGAKLLPADMAGQVRLVLEEAFTNIVKYAHPDGRQDHPIVVRLAVRAGWLELELIDEGVAFDPLAQAAPGFDQPLAERADGLMGIPLIRELVPDCRYRRIGRRNHLLLRKQVRPAL